VTFDHDNDRWQERVDGVVDEGADVVLLVSHGGVTGDGNDDDERLAAAVDGIDIIASGHRHHATEEALEVGDTILFEPGEYGGYVSQLDVTYNTTQGFISDYTFTLHPIDDSIAGVADVQAAVDAYSAAIDAQLQASPLGLTSGAVVAESSFDLELAPFAETGLGNLCADALRVVASTVVQGTAESAPFAVAALPSGVIRDPLYGGEAGQLTLADVYNVLPLGMSPADDQAVRVPGWPLVSMYLTAAEIRTVAEVGVSASQMLQSSSVWLNLGGMRVEIDPAQIITKVQRVYLCGNALPPGAPLNGDGDFFSETCDTRIYDLTDADFPADAPDLYRVVTDLYTVLSMKIALNAGFTIRPKDAAGTEVDLDDMAALLALRVDADPAFAGIQEITGWQALVNFLTEVLQDGGGVADVNEIPDAKYGEGGTALGRIAELPAN